MSTRQWIAVLLFVAVVWPCALAYIAGALRNRARRRWRPKPVKAPTRRSLAATIQDHRSQKEESRG